MMPTGSRPGPPVRPSRSKPDRGIVRSFVEVLNGNRQVVMTLSALTLILRRPARPGP